LQPYEQGEQMGSQIEYSPVRSDQRFKAADRALVLVDHGPEALLYHIIDISMGGLSFRYLGPRIKHPIKAISLYHDNKLLIDNIPIKTVSDYRMRDSLVPVRRASVNFDNLIKSKQNQLKEFIQNFAVKALQRAS
jgi:hypothetical protein